MRNRQSMLWMIVLLGAFLLSLPLAAAEPDVAKGSLARMSIAATRVDWVPQADYKHLVLTVAGPEGFYVQHELRAGEAPSFSSSDSQNGVLPDGVYAYELRSGGSAVQSGHLWVQGGSFVDKTTADLKPPIRKVTAQETDLPPGGLVVQGQACIGADCVPGDGSGPALKIKESGNYQIKFDGLNCCLPSEREWALQANGPTAFDGDFLIRDLTQGTIPFRIGAGGPNNTLTTWYNGNVGLGTSTPAQKLHIVGNGTATTTGVLIEDTTGPPASRLLMQFKNNGGVQVGYNDTSLGANWGTNVIGGNFRIAKTGAGVVAFDLQGNGNATFAGTVVQNSDRDTKTAIVPIQPEDVLAKLVSLPISTWSRKDDEPMARHLGPMAQDFAAAFGLGTDDRHIAPLDMAGVSMASIQALHSKMTQGMAEKDAEIAELRRENSALADRLASLEKLVTALVDRSAPATEAEPAP